MKGQSLPKFAVFGQSLPKMPKMKDLVFKTTFFAILNAGKLVYRLNCKQPI